jgi:hypothetical protein
MQSPARVEWGTSCRTLYLRETRGEHEDRAWAPIFLERLIPGASFLKGSFGSASGMALKSTSFAIRVRPVFSRASKSLHFGGKTLTKNFPNP